jgi:hypothetical protein
MPKRNRAGLELSTTEAATRSPATTVTLLSPIFSPMSFQTRSDDVRTDAAVPAQPGPQAVATRDSSTMQGITFEFARDRWRLEITCPTHIEELDQGDWSVILLPEYVNEREISVYSDFGSGFTAFPEDYPDRIVREDTTESRVVHDDAFSTRLWPQRVVRFDKEDFGVLDDRLDSWLTGNLTTPASRGQEYHLIHIKQLSDGSGNATWTYRLRDRNEQQPEPRRLTVTDHDHSADIDVASLQQEGQWHLPSHINLDTVDPATGHPLDDSAETLAAELAAMQHS